MKAVTLELAKHGVEAQGFRHDVMLYAFLLCADPSGCSPSMLAERYLDRKLGAAAEQHADLAVTLAERLAPEIDSRAFASCMKPSICRWPACWRAWSSRAFASIRRSFGVFPGAGHRHPAAYRRKSTNWPGKPFNINSPQQLGQDFV